MKLTFYIKILIMALLPVVLKAQNEQGYKIVGHLEGLRDGEKVVMSLSEFKGFGNYLDDTLLVHTDSGYVKNGIFQIHGVVPQGPRRYEMSFGINQRYLSLYIDNNEQITIKGDDINKIKHGNITHYVTIEGSPTNNSKLCLERAETIYWQSMARLDKSIKRLNDSIGFNGPLFDVLFKAREEINQAFYINLFYNGNVRDPDIRKADIFLPTSYSDFITSGHASFWMNYYQQLDEEKKSSFHGKWLGQLVKLCIEQQFPQFILPTPEGKNFYLKDILSKGKITAVLFWADKSINLEHYLGELKILYRRYHTKGLNVVCVSTDKYSEQWKDAISRYKMEDWYHVSDHMGTKGIVNNIYREYGSSDQPIRNTTIVLIDNQGKIIAWDTDGAELQWYLWKGFGE